MLGRSSLRLARAVENDLVSAARKHDEAAVRALIQAHNRMLFRLARSILPKRVRWYA